MLKSPISFLAYFLQVTPMEEKVLFLINDEPGITSADISSKLNIDKFNLSKSLSQMRKESFLVKTIKNRISHWELNKDCFSYGLINTKT